MALAAKEAILPDDGAIPRHGYAARVFGSCLLAWTLSSLDQSLFAYTIPSLMRDLGISLGAVGNILSLGFVMALFVTLFAGALADRIGRRLGLAIFLGLSAVAVGLTGTAGSLASLSIFRALGFSLGNSLSPITSAYISEAAPARYRGLFMAFLQCGYPLGWFAASLIAVPLLSTYGWRSIFYCAFLVVPVAVVLYFLLPESHRYIQVAKTSSAMTGAERIRILCSPPLRRRTFLAWSVYFFYGGAYAGSAFYFPTFFHAVRGYDEPTAAGIVGLAYGVAVFGYVGSAVVGEFILTRRNTISIWCIAGVASLLAVIWVPRTVTQDVMAFGVMAVFFYGVSGVLQTFVMELFPTSLRATGSALSASAGLCAGFAIFPIGTAWAVERLGWQWTFTLVIAPALLFAAVLVLGLDNLRSGQELVDA